MYLWCVCDKRVILRGLPWDGRPWGWWMRVRGRRGCFLAVALVCLPDLAALGADPAWIQPWSHACLKLLASRSVRLARLSASGHREGRGLGPPHALCLGSGECGQGWMLLWLMTLVLFILPFLSYQSELNTICPVSRSHHFLCSPLLKHACGYQIKLYNDYIIYKGLG